VAVAFNKFQQTVADLANKVHNLGADTLKIMLSNTAPTAVNAVKADIAEISAANGYLAGGNVVAIASSTQTAGLYKLIPSGNVVFTASGGSFGPFRYAVLYNSTPGAGPLIGWYDYGSSISVNSGTNFTVQLDQSAGILQLQ
jgi:hypothetical protein